MWQSSPWSPYPAALRPGAPAQSSHSLYQHVSPLSDSLQTVRQELIPRPWKGSPSCKVRTPGQRGEQRPPRWALRSMAGRLRCRVFDGLFSEGFSSVLPVILFVSGSDCAGFIGYIWNLFSPKTLLQMPTLSFYPGMQRDLKLTRNGSNLKPKREWSRTVHSIRVLSQSFL